MSVGTFIEAEKQSGHSVKRACEPLKVPRAAFYARRTGRRGPRAVRDTELTRRINEVHEQSRGTYGAPRVHAALRREGQRCGRRRVARLMRQAGLTGRHRTRRTATTIADPQATLGPDLIERDFHPDPAGADTRWCGDITYIPTEEGWLYLATVIDIATRRVVGWAIADHLRTELVADALRGACHQRRPAQPVIFHSDRGCQYFSAAYAALSRQFGVRLSVGRTGQCWDDALAESFFATLNANCSAPALGPPGPAPTARSSTSSRAGATCADSIAAWATAARRNTKPHSRPDHHHTNRVRQTGTSSNEQAALKCVYMAIMLLDPTGKGQARWTMRWKTALNAFDITFDGRLSAARQ